MTKTHLGMNEPFPLSQPKPQPRPDTNRESKCDMKLCLRRHTVSWPRLLNCSLAYKQNDCVRQVLASAEPYNMLQLQARASAEGMHSCRILDVYYIRVHRG